MWLVLCSSGGGRCVVVLYSSGGGRCVVGTL